MRWGDHAITAQAGAGHGRHYFLSSQPLDRDPAFTKRMFRHDCAKSEKCFVGGANCFAGNWAKKHLGCEDRDPSERG